MWQRFLAPKLMPERGTFAWYREMVLICTVFGITGSTTMMVSVPANVWEKLDVLKFPKLVSYFFTNNAPLREFDFR